MVLMWGASCSAAKRFIHHPFVEERVSLSGGRLPSKAQELFYLAREENPRLHWNTCLAGKARDRAEDMAHTGNFSHRDSRTGKNPAWEMIRSCLPSRYMGENLTKGDESALILHESLMKSPSHRKNIQDHRYDQLGVGCHNDICVQLFAGE